MSFLQREYDRINDALRDQENANKYDLLYAAQQAIAWASDPEAYKSPLNLITDTPANSEDCSERTRPPQS
jgi:hypothetical protein